MQVPRIILPLYETVYKLLELLHFFNIKPNCLYHTTCNIEWLKSYCTTTTMAHSPKIYYGDTGLALAITIQPSPSFSWAHITLTVGTPYHIRQASSSYPHFSSFEALLFPFYTSSLISNITTLLIFSPCQAVCDFMRWSKRGWWLPTTSLSGLLAWINVICTLIMQPTSKETEREELNSVNDFSPGGLCSFWVGIYSSDYNTNTSCSCTLGCMQTNSQLNTEQNFFSFLCI